MPNFENMSMDDLKMLASINGVETENGSKEEIVKALKEKYTSFGINHNAKTIGEAFNTTIEEIASEVERLKIVGVLNAKPDVFMKLSLVALAINKDATKYLVAYTTLIGDEKALEVVARLASSKINSSSQQAELLLNYDEEAFEFIWKMFVVDFNTTLFEQVTGEIEK